VGNATWRRASDESAPAAIARLGGQVASAARAQLAQLSPAADAALACSVRLVALPPPHASAAVPWLVRRAATNLLALADEPVVAQVQLDLPGLRLLGVPGEPVGSLAQTGEALVGLADGYVGYVEEPAALASGAGEAGRCYYGADLARALGL
jgi:hypothetical protein